MKLFLMILLLVWSNITLASDSTINVNNASQVAEVGRVSFDDTIIRDLAFQPGNNRLAIITLVPQTTLDGEITFLDTQTLEEVTLTDEPIQGTTLTFSPDGSLFAVGTEQGQINVYDTSALEKRWTFQASADIVNDLAISPNNAYIGATFAIPALWSEGDYAFRLLALPSGDEVAAYPLDADIYGGGITFNDDSEIVFFSTTDTATNIGVVHVWEIKTDSELATYDGFASNTHDLIIEPLSEELYFIVEDTTIGAVSPLADDARQERQLGSVQENETIMRISLHPNEPILAVGYLKAVRPPDASPPFPDEGIIRLYNRATGEELTSLEMAEGFVTSLAFNPDGTLLASGGTDGTVRLWGVPED